MADQCTFLSSVIHFCLYALFYLMDYIPGLRDNEFSVYAL